MTAVLTSAEFGTALDHRGLEESRVLAALLELTELVGRAPGSAAARRILVDHLVLFLEADAVWFVSGDAEHRRLIGSEQPTVATGNQIPPGSLGLLADECRLSRRPLIVASTFSDAPPAALCHVRWLAQNGFEAVATVSLERDDRVSAPRDRAAVIVAWKTSCPRFDEHVGFLRAARASLSSVISLLERSERGLIVRAREKLTEWARASTIRCLAAMAMAITGILAIPVPNPIACECEIEPVGRRFVAAPFDARLESARVKPGDVVEEGELLGRLDGRDLRVELAELAAKVGRAAKERDGHLAKHDTGEAELLRHELEQLSARYDLVSSRAGQLDIRAPIAGVVVAGDLHASQGIPLKTGQSLFEIAPLDAVRVLALVPEWEFDRLSGGQQVELRFEAVPDETFTARVDRILPRAEKRFEAWGVPIEVELDNSSGRLRPGMRGTAWVDQPRASLAERLFRRPWRAFRLNAGL